MKKNFVYGPVPSRRLGLSLGVDLVPPKVCCYDCTYCQVGRTTNLTIQRESFINPKEVVDEVEKALRERPASQIVTLSGSGEPTLYADLQELVDGLRRITQLPLALLTNGGLLWQPEVAEAAMGFDLVAPSLDAADAETFARINQPAPELSFACMLDGLRSFYSRYRGMSRLEIMLVKGVNDSPSSLNALSNLASTLKVTGVDLNTVVRPGAYPVQGLNEQEMQEAMNQFVCCKANIIASFKKAKTYLQPMPSIPEQKLLQRIEEMVARRPCSINDLSVSLGVNREELLPLCIEAVKVGTLEEKTMADTTYFALSSSRSNGGKSF